MTKGTQFSLRSFREYVIDENVSRKIGSIRCCGRDSSAIKKQNNTKGLQNGPLVNANVAEVIQSQHWRDSNKACRPVGARRCAICDIDTAFKCCFETTLQPFRLLQPNLKRHDELLLCYSYVVQKYRLH